MATEAEKVKMYREKAKDTSIPQEVRNTYLDRANELERKAYEATKTPSAPLAPEKKMAKGGMAKKAPAKAPVKGGKPVVAIMVGMAKPKGKAMMNKGGMAKKGKC
jgi:hypothetical protein